MQPYRTSPRHDKRGGYFTQTGDKAPPTIHHAQVIRSDLHLRFYTLRRRRRGRTRSGANRVSERRRAAAIPLPAQPFRRRPRPDLGVGERKGRAGRSAVFRRRLPRAPRRASAPRPALRRRAALPPRAEGAAASAKILRLNADEGALRDLRFAVGEELLPAARLLWLWRDLASRAPSLDPGRIFDVAARLELALPDPNGLASSLKACAGEGNPVSAAAQAAASPSPPSRTPQRPKPKSSPSGCSTWSSRSGSGGRGPFR